MTTAAENRKTEFPWRLFRRWLAGQALLAVPLLFLTGTAVFWWELSWNLIGAIAVTTVLTLLVSSYWTASNLIVPLGRLLAKARSLARRSVERAADEEFLEDAAEEWSDLDEELNRLQWAVRKQDERLGREATKVQTLMNALSVAVVAVDQDRRILFQNSRFEKLFQYTPAAHDPDGALPDARAGIADVIANPEVVASFDRVLEAGEPQTVRIQVPAAGGDRYYELSSTPLGQETGKPADAALGVFHDITDLKMAELIRVEFVANVSHELRTPLTSIKGYSDTLRLDSGRGDTRLFERYLGVISRNVDRLLNLVNDLLDLSSLESGLELHRSVIDLHELTEKGLAPLEKRAQEKNQRIETRFGASTLTADPKRVEQVMTNLVDNALKYIPEEKSVLVAWEQESDGSVVMRVKDNGPGIPQEHLPRLFERFYRVDKARSRELGGTGLGLAIVKHILQAHGGTVQVRSSPGEGTEFICRFPPRKRM